ncbi:MAG: hypothetical protein KatS3mg124_0711 [Porticoccaceae bacterium]|nr:MAG: hypothetical protein KatS3mg124_0711 [Porticoccaceae bacterium]
MDSRQPFHVWTLPDGTPWAEFYRGPAGYRVDFPGVAQFSISADGRQIAARPAPGVPDAEVAHLLRNNVEPLARSRRLELVLHAAAVAVEDIALAFLGTSGRGKSTLAAAFAARGFSFLADDGLALDRRREGWLALPSHPAIRLWPDSLARLAPARSRCETTGRRPKFRLLAGPEVPHCGRPLPIGALYFLEESAAVGIAPVSPRDALIELVRHSFLLDVEEERLLRHHFAALGGLVRSTPAFRLAYPRRYEALPAVLAAVLGHRKVAADLEP